LLAVVFREDLLHLSGGSSLAQSSAMTLTRAPLLFAASLLALVMATAPAAAASTPAAARLDSRLRQAAEEQSRDGQRVIVRVRPGSRASVRRALVDHGDRILAEHAELDAITALVHGDDVAALAQHDFIVSVSSDAPVRANLLGGLLGVVGGVVDGVVDVLGSILLPNGADTSGAAVPPSVLRSTLGVNNATATGKGVGVAIIDSGLEMSSDFYGRVTAFYDFTKGGVAASPYDDYGHGTHVAGTIGGSGAMSQDNNYRGVAPNVKLVVLKVLDKTGAGWTSDVIRAIDFAVANRFTLKIDIINLSLGHPIYEPAATDPLVQAVERAARAGLIVVASAGNFGKNPETGLPGYAGITSPGNAPSAITVGAVRTEDTASRHDDRIADYSSAGPSWYDAFVKPDVVAPGHNIVAIGAKQGTLYKTYPALKAADGDYMRLSGTSMAAAVATGSIALLLETNRTANQYPTRPSLTPNAVKAILQYTALEIHDKAGATYDPLRKGGGSLNAKGGIDLGRAINTSAAPGTYWLTAPPSPWTKIAGDYLSWSREIIWGAKIAWGTTIEANHGAWSTQIIWGTDDQIIWGTDDQIIWGTDMVWLGAQAWTDTVVWGTDAIGVDNGNTVVWGTTGGLTPDTTAWKSLTDATSTTAGVSATALLP
jgi:serine protease AprX